MTHGSVYGLSWHLQSTTDSRHRRRHRQRQRQRQRQIHRHKHAHINVHRYLLSARITFSPRPHLHLHLHLHLRPHHILDGLPVISWRHFLQVRSKLKLGRAVGTDGLNAEVVQCLSMRQTLLLWCTLNVSVWASTSPKTRGAILKAVRHMVHRCRQVCLDATLAKVTAHAGDSQPWTKFTMPSHPRRCCASPRAQDVNART